MCIIVGNAPARSGTRFLGAEEPGARESSGPRAARMVASKELSTGILRNGQVDS